MCLCRSHCWHKHSPDFGNFTFHFWGMISDGIILGPAQLSQENLAKLRPEESSAGRLCWRDRGEKPIPGGKTRLNKALVLHFSLMICWDSRPRLNRFNQSIEDSHLSVNTRPLLSLQQAKVWPEALFLLITQNTETCGNRILVLMIYSRLNGRWNARIHCYARIQICDCSHAVC